MKNGMSDPITSAISARASRDNFVSNSWLSASRVEAASMLPPPRPAPCGIFFLSSMETAGFNFVAAKKLFVARTIKLSPPGGTDGSSQVRGLAYRHVERSRDIPCCQSKVTPRDPSTSLGMTNAADKIIVALDVATKEKALDLVRQLRDQISFFKIGLQLYTAEGPEIVRAVLSAGAKVWLDIKLHDIPNTVARAVESANNLGVHMLTIHLSGGSEMIRAATAAGANNMSILGVT